MTAESTTRRLTGTDPRTGRSVGTGVPEAGPEEAVAAARAAAEAVRTRPERGEPGGFDDAALLDAVATGLEEATTDLVAVAAQETGLAPERLAGEVARTGHQLRAVAPAARDGLGARPTIQTAPGTPV